MIIGYVRGQELKVKSPLIAADSIDYLTAQFVFHTKDWDGCRKFTHWKCGETNHTIELENDRIDEEQHLNLTAGTWAVWIHGEVYRDGELIQRITTDEAQIEVKATGSMGGSPFPDAPVSDIERINAELDELREMIEPSGGENSKTTVVDLEQTDNDSVLIPSHTSQEIYDLIRSGHQVTAEVHDDATGESTIFFPVLATAASVMFVNELPGDVSDHDVAYHVVAISGDAAHANDGVYIKEMGGANAGNDGTSGLAPAPVRGQQGHALFGDATWKRAYTADQTDGLIASLSEAIADLELGGNAGTVSAIQSVLYDIVTFLKAVPFDDTVASASDLDNIKIKIDALGAGGGTDEPEQPDEPDTPDEPIETISATFRDGELVISGVTVNSATFSDGVLAVA